MTIEFRGTEFADACETVQHADVAGAIPITIAGRYFAVAPAEADRLDAMGITFAYLSDHQMPDLTHRLINVPVN